MIAFVPQRCRGHICDIALDLEIENLSASHVFMPTDHELTREQVFSEMPGVIYRKD